MPQANDWQAVFHPGLRRFQGGKRCSFRILAILLRNRFEICVRNRAAEYHGTKSGFIRVISEVRGSNNPDALGRISRLAFSGKFYCL